MRYKIDIKRISDNNVHINGWVLPKNPSDVVNFYVYKNNVEIKDFTLARTKREDVYDIYINKKHIDKDLSVKDYFGFNIIFPFDDNPNNVYKLVIKTNKEKIIEKITKESIYKFNSYSYRNKEQVLSYLNMTTFKRAFEFLLSDGIVSFIKKVIRKLKGLNVEYIYSEWYDLTKTTDEELNSQKNNTNFLIKPFYSIVIPVYDTCDEFLEQLFKSILNQTYQNFEVCVADATDYKIAKNNPKKFFEKLNNKKVRIKYLNENKSISDNTNVAIQMSRGDYIVLCDHDDELTYDALYEVTKSINQNSAVKFIYSDEDKVDTKGKFFFEPAFKSDFNLDMILSVNYFCHLSVVKKEILDELYSIDGCYERNEYNGAQDYDLFLRIVNLIINKYDVKDIVHISKVLYHWRCHKNSTSKNIDSKDYAFKNGEKAIENFYKISKINFGEIDRVEKGFDYGIYHTVYKKNYEPLISVIIPNKDHIEDLNKCIVSLFNGNYKNLEIIVCENNSILKETFDYYSHLTKKYNNVKVVTYKDTFNYSKINNYAVKYTSGDYYLFLNNDIEMISKDSIFEMISFARRKDVGAVGAKLLYNDNTIQHAGVVLGFGGIAGHTFIGLNNYDHCYQNRAHFVQDYNAVTAACLLLKKETFESIDGFDENIAVAFNDIDLCIKIRQKGKLIVYNPYAVFYHYESKSRGYENTKEKVDRFNRETAYMYKKWPDVFNKIDEYYNKNLTLRKSNFSLRDLNYEKIGEIFPIPDEIESIVMSL